MGVVFTQRVGFYLETSGFRKGFSRGDAGERRTGGHGCPENNARVMDHSGDRAHFLILT